MYFRFHQISAHDPDDYKHNEFTYSLFPKENRVFSIDEHTGIIKARTTFDHEVEKRLNVIVLATDTNKPSLVGTATVVVNIVVSIYKMVLFRLNR